MKLEVIPESVVRQVLTRRLAYDAVRDAFIAVANGEAKLFDVLVADGLRSTDSYAVKAATDNSAQAVGFKVGSYWPNNARMNLPAHAATTMLLNAETGYPSLLINATFLNGYRTAAANAVATDLLARQDASMMTVFGAGHQAEQEIRALCEVRQLAEIVIVARSRARGEALLERLSDLQVNIRLADSADVERSVRSSDIIVTVTPAKEVLVRREWIKPGAHISAMGADTPGKYELDPELVAGAKLFADHPEQSLRIGEFELAHKQGHLKDAGSVTPIGLVLQGRADGRTDESDITVFDSSGLAAQDLSVATRVANLARKRGSLTSIEL